MRKSRKIIIISLSCVILFGSISFYFLCYDYEPKINTNYKSLYRQIRKNVFKEYKDFFSIYKVSDYEDELLAIKVDFKEKHVKKNKEDLILQYKLCELIAREAEKSKNRIILPKTISVVFVKNIAYNSSGMSNEFTLNVIDDKYAVDNFIMNNNYAFTDLAGLSHTSIRSIEFWGYGIEEIKFLSEFENLEHLYLGSFFEGDERSEELRKRINAILPDCEVRYYQ